MGLSVLTYFASDQKIERYEAIILFALYLGYVLVMYYNDEYHAFVKARVPWAKNEPWAMYYDKSVDGSDGTAAVTDLPAEKLEEVTAGLVEPGDGATTAAAAANGGSGVGATTDEAARVVEAPDEDAGEPQRPAQPPFADDKAGDPPSDSDDIENPPVHRGSSATANRKKPFSCQSSRDAIMAEARVQALKTRFDRQLFERMMVADPKAA
jgi:hypothetical protein